MINEEFCEHLQDFPEDALMFLEKVILMKKNVSPSFKAQLLEDISILHFKTFEMIVTLVTSIFFYQNEHC